MGRFGGIKRGMLACRIGTSAGSCTSSACRNAFPPLPPPGPCTRNDHRMRTQNSGCGGSSPASGSNGCATGPVTPAEQRSMPRPVTKLSASSGPFGTRRAARSSVMSAETRAAPSSAAATRDTCRRGKAGVGAVGAGQKSCACVCCGAHGDGREMECGVQAGSILCRNPTPPKPRLDVVVGRRRMRAHHRAPGQQLGRLQRVGGPGLDDVECKRLCEWKFDGSGSARAVEPPAGTAAVRISCTGRAALPASPQGFSPNPPPTPHTCMASSPVNMASASGTSPRQLSRPSGATGCASPSAGAPPLHHVGSAAC